MMTEISVKKGSKELELIEKIEPVLASMNFHCRDIEVISGRSALVRVTIEHAESTDQNVSIDDCSEVHRVLGPMFDVWDPLPGAYTLEVSSPGEKPSLRVLKHFQEAVGEKIKFQTSEAIELPPPSKARKNWEVTLKEVTDEGLITVEDFNGLSVELKIPEVKNALWLREWNP